MMGRTHNVSEGYQYGFVPDNGHAFETMADSEGYGSSGRVDTEMTASKDSCAPRRKTVNFVNNSYQQFSVPLQVLSLSKMSTFERKQLELRLKRELEQVRTFQKNFEQGLSSSSDVYSCSDGQRKPVPELARSTPSKKRVGNGNAVLMKQCETLLNRLMGYKFGWLFNTPVDVVALNIPDYYKVIKHPMDLGTVKTRLKSRKYIDPWGFASDVRLTFSNAMTYNPRGNDVHVMAETLSKFFEVRWKPIEKKIQKVLEAEDITVMPPFKKKKTTSFTNEIKQEPIKKKIMMTVAEKQKLSGELESSIADLPENIIDFLKENSLNKNATMDDEIEIDIDALGDDALFKLRKLLDDFLLQNESGVSNLSMQEVKVNDANEEEIDIGGNDFTYFKLSHGDNRER